jgi:protein-tyrosine phosphatase
MCPLAIDAVATPNGGLIGMTLCPGKRADPAPTADPGRDLDADLDRILLWRAAVVLSLLETREMAELGATSLPDGVRRRGMEWAHLDLPDAGIPDACHERHWSESLAAVLHGELGRPGRVLLHCRGGLGRTGTMAARLLVECGVPPIEAIDRVRRARPGAIGNTLQEQYVLALPYDPMAAAAVRAADY